MKIAGIHFAPLLIPFRRRLETLSAFIVLSLFTFGIFVFLGVAIALMFTRYWWLMSIYWIWIIWDRETALLGGRQYKWFQRLKLFQYARNYYSISFTKEFEYELETKKNYIVPTFPHGLFPTGTTLLFGADTPEKRTHFTTHKHHTATLAIIHFIPFYREIIHAFGGCGSSKRVLTKILQSPDAGKLIALYVGGAKESQYSFDGRYHLVLKDRKGFIKLALENGANLIPVFVFGERTLFKYYKFPKDSAIRKFQDWFKKVTGLAISLFYGRGFFQYTFGVMPFRRPLHFVMGHIIEVEKVENPKQQDIDELHKKFVDNLLQLFEKYKYKFEKNPESVSIEIH